MKLFTKGPLRAALLALGLAALPGLSQAQTCPNVELSGQAIDQNAGALAAGQTFPVVAGGNVDMMQCADVPGGGYVAESPDFELSLSGSAGAQDLQLAVTAGCDATLLVNDASGTWQYADDNDGSTNPRLVLPAAQDGVYDIWIGTFSSDTCDATLSVQTFAAGTAPSTDIAPPATNGTCPDPSMESAVLAYDMGQLATSQVTEVIAGGDVDLFFCNELSGSGYVIQAPDFEMQLSGNTSGADVTIGVAADCDAVLLVNDATGQWLFNDDANGTFDPEIVLAGGMDGIYDIWIGSLGAESCNATLTISGPGGGKGPAAPAPAPTPDPATTGGGKGPAAPAPATGGDDPVAPAGAAEADPGNLTAYRADVGAVLTFEVTGSTDGFVWGSDVYTDDTDLSTAAVHAGILQPGETGIVTVEMLGPQSGFQASERNGVDSSAFGSWGGSYGFIAG